MEQTLQSLPRHQYTQEELKGLIEDLLIPTLETTGLGIHLERWKKNLIIKHFTYTAVAWGDGGEQLQKALQELKMLESDELISTLIKHPSQLLLENSSERRIKFHKLSLINLTIRVRNINSICSTYLENIQLIALLPFYLAIEPRDHLYQYLDRETHLGKVNLFLVDAAGKFSPAGTASSTKPLDVLRVCKRYPKAKELRDQYLEIYRSITPLLEEMTIFQADLKTAFEFIQSLTPPPQILSPSTAKEDSDSELSVTPTKRKKKKKKNTSSPSPINQKLSPPPSLEAPSLEAQFIGIRKSLSSLKQHVSNSFAKNSIDNASYHALMLMQNQTPPASREELLCYVANCIQHSQLLIEQLLLSSLLNKSSEEPQALASHNLLKLAEPHLYYESLYPLLKKLQLGDLSTRGIDAQHETQATRLMQQAVRASSQDTNALESSLDEYLKLVNQALSFIAPGLSFPSPEKTSLTHSICPYPKAFNSLTECIKKLYLDPLPPKLATNLLPRLGRERQRSKTLSPSQAHLHLYNMTFLTRLIAEEFLSNAMQSSDYFTQHPHDLLGACHQIGIETESLQLFLQTAAQTLRHIRYPHTHDAGIDSPQKALEAAEQLMKLQNAWNIQHEQGFQFEQTTQTLLSHVKERTQADFEALCSLAHLLSRLSTESQSPNDQTLDHKS